MAGNSDPGKQAADPLEALDAPIESWQHGPSIAISRVCIHHLFESQVERAPESIALIDEEQQLTYAQLNAVASELASRLAGLGVGPDVIVATCFERSIDQVVSLLAILKAGGAYLALHPAWPKERTDFLLKDAGCSVLIDQRGVHPLAAANAEARASACNLAYVSYTSGSTGVPKGVAVEHHSVLRLVHPVNGFRLGPGASVLQLAPVAFDAATFEIWGPLLNGGTLVVIPPGVPSLNELADYLKHYRITTLWLTAGLFHAMVQEELEALAGVPQVLAGGDVLHSASAQRLLDAFAPGHELINGYGPTEGTTFTCCHSMQAGQCVEGRSIPIGKPIANTSVYVLSQSGERCPIGVIGELHIGGSGLAREYLKNPELTAEKFIVDPFSSGCGSRLYKSGDLVSWTPDGALAFHGRIDQQIKLRGFRIEPGEIEANLLAHASIAQAAVILSSDDPSSHRLIAYWIPEKSASNELPDSEQLRLFLSQRLPDYMVPSAFVVLEALPLTPNGKLDRPALPPPSRAAEFGARVPPSSELEHQLHAIWAEVLGHSDFGISDDLFLCGANSLSAAGVASRLSRALGRDIALSSLFRARTIQAFLQELDSAGDEFLPPLGRVSRDAEAPVSLSQERLWHLIHSSHEYNYAYHLQVAFELNCNIDLERLREALAALIDRHEILRTTFINNGLGESPSMVVREPWIPEVGIIDLEGDDGPSIDASIQTAIERLSNQPFNLAELPLVRWQFARRRDGSCLLLHCEHHLIHDGWTLHLLMKDLDQLYRSDRAIGAVGIHRRSRVDFVDVSFWQRQYLDELRRSRMLTFWRDYLKGVPDATGIPARIQSSLGSRGHQGMAIEQILSSEEVQSLLDLCRLNDATLFDGMLVAFSILVSRLSGQDDLCIGSGVANRRLKEMEGVAGMFVNNIPLRVSVLDDESFSRSVRRLRDDKLLCLDNQDLPFEDIVRVANPQRMPGRHPLFQIMFSFHDSPLPAQGLESPIQGHARILNNKSAKFDLNLIGIPVQAGSIKGAVKLWWEFSTELYTETDIRRLMHVYGCLLSNLVADPDAPIGRIPLVCDEELSLCRQWGVGCSPLLPELSVAALFDQQVERTPDAIALIFEDEELAYGELNARANTLAHHLIERGVGPEVIVAVCLERSVELIVSLLAILKAGGAYLALDPSWPQERIDVLLQDSRCAVRVDQKGVHCFGSPEAASLDCSSRSLAYLAYTSGSTGIPKGVAIEHRSILRLVDPSNGFSLGSGARVLQLAPVAFDAATFEIWGPLLNGGTVVVAPPGAPSLSALASCLKQYQITTLWLTAGLFHAMVEAELDALAGVSQLLAGGDVLNPIAVQRLLDAFPPGHELINGYGPTENTTFTCCHRMKAGERIDCRTIPLGKPIAHTSVHVLNRLGECCPVGVIGELHIGGWGLARGYLNHPELTAEKFIADPFSADPTARLYQSGDLASWNSDGTLAFHGRIDQQIKLRGFRIEPGEIEAALLAHDAIAHAAVMLRRDDPANPRLVGYWVAQPRPASEPPTAEELRVFLAQRLPAAMVPSAFVALEALPLTANGKLDRQALPAPSFAGDLNQRVAPASVLERQLHAIWSEVLGHSDFGLTDHFFVIGGHSLLAARLIGLLQQQLGSAMTVPDVFRLPTIAEQVQHLEELDGGSAQSSDRSRDLLEQCLVTLQPDGDLPPLYVIHGGFGAVGHFVPLARALSPRRPVLGLQAAGAERGKPVGASPREMAAEYAEQILRRHPGGAIHLLGASAGGWYAHAVAEALLERGAAIGMLAILDTSAGARVHRRVRWRMLASELLPRMGTHLSGLLRPPAGQGRSVYASERLRALHHQVRRYLGVGLPLVPAGEQPSSGQADPLRGDAFVELLREAHRPTRLPISVDLFATPRNLSALRTLWRFYAREGVRSYPMFEDHADFFDPELMPELAVALAEVLAQWDRAS